MSFRAKSRNLSIIWKERAARRSERFQPYYATNAKNDEIRMTNDETMPNEE